MFGRGMLWFVVVDKRFYQIMLDVYRGSESKQFIFLGIDLFFTR